MMMSILGVHGIFDYTADVTTAKLKRGIPVQRESPPEGITTVRAGWGTESSARAKGLGWLCISRPALGLPPGLWMPAVTVACAGSPALVVCASSNFLADVHCATTEDL